METKKTRWMFNAYYVTGLLAVTVVTIVLHLTADNPHHVTLKNDCILQRQPPRPHDPSKEKESINAAADDGGGGGHEEYSSRCDLFSGRWVLDKASYPLYEEAECSFMKPDYACQKYGRTDLTYQYWAWKPHACQLPRFNGTELMEKIGGKRVVFVGDSLNRNQWTSLLCLIESSLHKSSQKSVVRNDNLFVFNATEYNATIEFYWSPFLVESNTDDPYNHSINNEIIMRINSIEKHARVWSDADILIFDSFMWWVKPNLTLLWGSFDSPNAIRKVVEKSPSLYEMCLNTWSDWVAININPTKTKLFFMSLSPYHYNGERWDGRTCYNETEPALKEDYWGVETDREMMRTAESVVQRLAARGVHVQYLNITHLSDSRKDAHTSINKKYRIPKPKEMDPKTYADCVHWCLPGVPDVWNIILYHYIINS